MFIILYDTYLYYFNVIHTRVYPGGAVRETRERSIKQAWVGQIEEWFLCMFSYIRENMYRYPALPLIFFFNLGLCTKY